MRERWHIRAHVRRYAADEEAQLSARYRDLYGDGSYDRSETQYLNNYGNYYLMSIQKALYPFFGHSAFYRVHFPTTVSLEGNNSPVSGSLYPQWYILVPSALEQALHIS